jgi:adenylate cyclase
MAASGRTNLSWSSILQRFIISYSFSAISATALQRVTGVAPWIGTLIYGSSFAFFFTLLSVLRLDTFRFRSYFLTLLLRTASYGAVVICSFIVGILVNMSVRTKSLPWSANVLTIVGEIVSRPYLVIPGLVAIGMAFMISSVQAVARKLGPGVMTNWLRGYYHEPREEDRIFMFLDMKDSTAHAERLGHLKFSALIRDFMADLTGPVYATRAEVSHYIGDEAVLTWQLKNGIRESNVLRLFFLFRDRLENRRDHYLKNYGVVPSFKAGAHVGTVVTTEVGEVKSEIVFHGDVLNTAARIQSLCNELEEPLLISGELAGLLRPDSAYRIELLGERALKGRVQHVSVCAVHQKGRTSELSDKTLRRDRDLLSTLK